MIDRNAMLNAARAMREKMQNTSAERDELKAEIDKIKELVDSLGSNPTLSGLREFLKVLKELLNNGITKS